MTIVTPTHWQPITKYQSATLTQRFLSDCYRKGELKDAETLSYENCYSFIYHLEHGEKYYIQASKAPLELRPILLFYGMIQLLKACILTVDPHYPENSQVLAHGVSSRKRKKSNYEFLNDEVRLQKNGLLSHFYDKMFHMKHLEGEKYKMEVLLKQVPELHPLFACIYKKPISYRLQKTEESDFKVTAKLLDDFNLGVSSWGRFLNTRTRTHLNEPYENNGYVVIPFEKPLNRLDCAPFLRSHSGNYYLLRIRDDYLTLPEIVVHYLLLYNLSMICRYETEWWGDLFHNYSSTDFPFIKQFLMVTETKIPSLLFQFLGF
ncbi:YaaC family protein [Desertibacillus haloalkaliphilus]|uniref:YaaC family protein n=1 Tax=Desertibacillus haloalkaliphilus TaxID=1328930 RepID=UPI001C27547D|nr:YaaC family protein [Desertibacillus haloalkaliphilus]MBU8908389.1 YaaC family protein [Desertibacillus haloalkaliphilus]